MQSWLLIAAASQIAGIATPEPSMKGLSPMDIGQVATTHALDFRLKQESLAPGPVPLMRGMIVHREVAPNAAVGIGLSNLLDKKRVGEGNDGARPKRSRKPAVTFVLKF